MRPVVGRGIGNNLRDVAQCRNGGPAHFHTPYRQQACILARIVVLNLVVHNKSPPQQGAIAPTKCNPATLAQKVKPITRHLFANQDFAGCFVPNIFESCDGDIRIGTEFATTSHWQPSTVTDASSSTAAPVADAARPASVAAAVCGRDVLWLVFLFAGAP
eukprot:CAMPEP_0172816120 /NCGR_PEP_ID=MMETSP1075-20121228/12227_1 /TAXON_ID=2916 /ORGANISM="Ceratium fusus, Strain PA161109" /LENGTH=159 /DNA_ID=CAMNT_0013656053 /DNA_START=121 /DNA_END=601 /DNA_ORIENTATION=-